MKAITCEMCGGIDLLKQDGVFICQSCGTKYSVEEAKKLMVEGIVNVEGVVKIDNTSQIQNYIDLSHNAYQGGNGQSAFDYANKALELAPLNSRAWIAKMKSLEYLGTLGNLRLAEVVEAGKNAIDHADEETAHDITFEVYHYELMRSFTLLKIAATKMKDTTDIIKMQNLYLRVNILTAATNTRAADESTVGIYLNIENEAIGMAQAVPDEVLAEFAELATLVRLCAKQFQSNGTTLDERYKQYASRLSDGAIEFRAATRRSMEARANAAIIAGNKKRAEEKENRVKAYWDAHPEEKVELDNKKASAVFKKNSLLKERECVPGLNEQEAYKQKIATLIKEKALLGLFSGKEKKAIQARIDATQIKLNAIKPKVDAAIAEVQRKINEIDKMISEIDRQLSNIE